MEFTVTNSAIFQGGKKVSIKGANWFGLETEVYCLHGLWSVSMKSILDFIQQNGFNAVRVPFSAEVALGLDKLKCKSINTTANPDLIDITPGKLLDKLVIECHKRGILIMPDMHRLVGTGQITELWYDNELGYTEAKVIEAWKVLVKRYTKYPNVFAVDLKNEPHGKATWGTGNLETDWNKAAERIGDAILEINPKLLIVVEGVQTYKGEGTWWGGNLAGAKDVPVRLKVPSKLVYSPHVYGPSVFAQPYFSNASFPNNMQTIWDNHFGFLEKTKQGCILIGEWGGWMKPDNKDDVWQNAMGEYFIRNSIDAFYWCVNPNSGDTGGLLDDDWKTPITKKLELLKKVHPNPTKFNFTISTIIKPPTPTPTPTPTQTAIPSNPSNLEPQKQNPPSTPSFRIDIVDKNSWLDGNTNITHREVTITNTSATPLRSLNLKLTTGQLLQIWNVTNNNGILSFPDYVKESGIAPGATFTFGMISSGPTSLTSASQ
jgi:endoglucanase